MWFLLALAGALLWTAVNLYDKVAVRTIFTRASQGLFVSGLFSGLGLILALAVGWQIPNSSVFWWATAGAILLQVSQFFYFRAMESEEVGDLVAYGSTYPLVVAIAAIPLGKILDPVHWVGIVVVVIGVASIEWKRTSHSLKAKLDIVGYVLGLAASSLIMDEVLQSVRFQEVLIPYTFGLFLGGMAPMLLGRERQELSKVWPKLKDNMLAFGTIEAINIVALLCEVAAIGLGHPALVNTVASAEPAFVLVFAQLLGNVHALREYFPKTQALHQKMLIVLTIVVGLVLVAWPR